MSTKEHEVLVKNKKGEEFVVSRTYYDNNKDELDIVKPSKAPKVD